MTRRGTYTILLLLACLLALLPAALWADLIVPMKDNWENWYWKGQPHPRPEFSLQHPPALFKAEETVFRILVIPPGYLRRVIRGDPTDFAVPWVAPYHETAGLPPLASTLSHVAWALPLWFVLLASMYEFARRLRSRGHKPDNQ
jgi:hypothetical protein